MGATGTGKTKLSIDISKVIGDEVINTNKMQIYAGLTLQLTRYNQATKVVFLITYLGLFHQLLVTCLHLPFDLLQRVLLSLLQGVADFQL